MKRRRALPEYVSEFADRHGKLRIRFRKKGQAAYYFKAPLGSPEFLAEYRACLDGVAAPAVEVGANRIVPGTFHDLITRFYRTPSFMSTRESTKQVRRRILERFRAEHGDRKVSDLRYQHLEKIFAGMEHTPHAANSLRKILRRVMRYAQKIEMRTDNPVDLVEPYAVSSDGFHTWTDEEIGQFEDRHPVGSKARLALGLMLYLGQRRSDAVKMGRQHIKNGRISVRQQKTNKLLHIAIHWKLQTILDAAPKDNLTLLTTSFGKPFTANGFGNWFRERCNEAGLPQCSAHGLRKAAATRMAEAGCTAHQLMAVCGFGLAEAERYTKAADQARLADQGMDTLTRSQMANRTEWLDNPSSNPHRIKD